MKKINLRNAVKVLLIGLTGATVQVLTKAPYELSGNPIPYNMELVSALLFSGIVVFVLLGVLIKKIVHHA